MRRRLILQRPLDTFKLVISVALLAGLIAPVLPAVLQTIPRVVVTVAPTITHPVSGETLGADELQALEGTADPGVTLRAFDGDQLLGETVAAQDGTFRLDLETALSSGPHIVRVAVMGRSGREMIDSTPLAFTIIPPPQSRAAPRTISPIQGPESLPASWWLSGAELHPRRS